MSMKKELILIEYDEKQRLYSQFSLSIASLINTLLSASEIDAHSVNSRVKERSSLQKKIDKKDKYKSLSELTDIVGIRIITHYSDDVDLIADLIEKEFLIDVENSIDKRASLDPDRFGYLSLHYVAEISESRSGLPEYRGFKSLKFEIQIRSILQHTWAEIEHDIGYKSKIEIPKQVRRKFSQLAGLLELADDQFIQIRNELDSYENDVHESIEKTPQFVSIDKVSLYNYANTSNFLNLLDLEIAEIIGVELVDSTKDKAASHVKYSNYFGIESISEIEESLELNRGLIIQRAKDVYVTKTDETKLSKGISIFYMYQVLGSKIKTEEEILKFLDEMKLSSTDERNDFASYLHSFGK
ncbi:hypothetical protein L2755_04620 [Shewanella abyssi]|uniref:GTP pyrophosphokinase n=1 Tax=Shewanella abyssi TaxID=311789 RepID=UPI00200CDCDE|nr:hypothetical protein [Shewanella abyssi]MCL1048913.1 hypothetical protein [Shewanella abyssi]